MFSRRQEEACVSGRDIALSPGKKIQRTRWSSRIMLRKKKIHAIFWGIRSEGKFVFFKKEDEFQVCYSTQAVLVWQENDLVFSRNDFFKKRR
jgi:hypothetical protein